ncbi:MAG TPA: hypothetical protein VM914_04020 [Pyrinomonadaceae bacterium]|jgi:hypothetical protein|nr:hypothetical protein [Pyrinomonadaceae bacterium]
MGLWTFALLIFLISLACGYWRASVRKGSGRWMLAVFLPAAAIVALRNYSGLDLGLKTYSAAAVAYCLGQFVGGRLRNIIQGRGPGRSHG